MHRTEDSWYCLVKGSPEALKTLMVPESIPSWYSKSYESLARRGLRVLALAFKKVSLKDTPRPLEQPRSWVESQLHFGGFIAFECKIRADSGIVMSALLQSDHKVCMITGDALLTSLHVAKKVSICSEKLPCLTLNAQAALPGSAITKPFWMLYDDATGEESEVVFDAKTVAKLGEKYNLLTTEEAFNAAANATGGKTSPLWAQAG
jgi:cation-transporting ATPase 13A1